MLCCLILSLNYPKMTSVKHANQVRLLILPNLDPYLRLLEPEMQLEKQKNEIKRHEAWLVYGALLVRYVDPFFRDKEWLLKISCAMCIWCYLRRFFQIYMRLFFFQIPVVFDDTLTLFFCCHL